MNNLITLRPYRKTASVNPTMNWLTEWYKGRDEILDENISSWNTSVNEARDIIKSSDFKNKDIGFQKRVLGLKSMYGMPDFYNEETLTSTGTSNPFDYTDESYYGFNEKNGLLNNDNYKNALFNNLNTVNIKFGKSSEKPQQKVFSSTGGVYNNNDHEISLFPLSEEYYHGKRDFDNSILFHEGTHATNFTPALAKIQKYFIDNHSKLKDNNDSYWDDANEIYSRLM